MFSKILVGVDGSDTALHAAKVAAQLAETTQAELHVISAVDDTAPVSTGGEFGDGRTLTPGEIAEAIANQVAGQLEVSTTVHTGPRAGKPAEALVDVAREIDADLIVVGNRRVQGIGRVLGSVARGVAQHAPCDVYVVKTH